MVADIEETRAKKLQMWINGALSKKVTPSNTRVRQSGCAQVINTRTDNSIASTFGTNNNIMMHSLINSIAADLRKIKLQMLLRRLLWRDPNKYYSTN